MSSNSTNAGLFLKTTKFSVILTFQEDEQRVIVQLVYLDYFWTWPLCKSTQTPPPLTATTTTTAAAAGIQTSR